METLEFLEKLVVVILGGTLSVLVLAGTGFIVRVWAELVKEDKDLRDTEENEYEDK
jgi:hypothetical protein